MVKQISFLGAKRDLQKDLPNQKIRSHENNKIQTACNDHNSGGSINHTRKFSKRTTSQQ
jgi:hypothetical protein